MEESLSLDDLASMRKAHYEAKDREMAWTPTSYHGYECTSTYQEELPYGNYVEENQYEYGERFQSFDMEYEYEEAYGNEEAYGYEGVYNYEDVCSYEGAYNHEEASPSPIDEQEDIYNMLKLFLERQEYYSMENQKQIDAFKVALESDSRDMNIQEKSMDEGMLTDCHEDDSIINPPTPTSEEDPSSFTLPYAIEKKEHKPLSWDKIEEIFKSWDEESDKAQLMDFETSSSISEEPKEVGKDTMEDYPLSEFNAPKEELKYLSKEGTFLLKDKETIRELERLLSYMVDGNLLVMNEDTCEDVEVEECMEVTKEKSFVENELSHEEHIQLQPTFKQESKVEEPLEKQENLIHLAFKEGYEEETPKAKPFSKHLGIDLTITLGVYDQWKLPLFEEVRMNEFRGWFYDEYDPGDPLGIITPSLKRVQGVDSKDAFVEKIPLSDPITA